MKRARIICILVILSVLSLIGCSGASDQNVSGKDYCFDYQTRTMASFGYNYIYETDDSIYFLLNGIMYLSDKENKDLIPLCARPDCGHNNIDCSAYTDALAFTIYGDSIYYIDGFYDNNYFLDGVYIDDLTEFDIDDNENELHVPVDNTHPALWRMKLDGTAHEKIMELEIPKTDFIATFNSWLFCFSNRFLIAGCRQAGDTNEAFDMYTLALDTLELHPASCGWADLALNIPVFMAGRGDKLYCMITDSVNNMADGTQVNYICELNCATGALRKIGAASEDLFANEFCFYLDEDALYYTCWKPGDQERRICRCMLDSGESIEAARGGYNDVEWNQFDWQNGMLFKDYRNDNDSMQKGIYYTDLDFKRVDFHPYADDELETVSKAKIKAFFQTESYIFGVGPSKYNTYGAQNGLPKWYIDKADIGSGNLMWKRWTPEG